MDCAIDQIRSSNIIESVSIFNHKNIEENKADITGSVFFLMRKKYPEKEEFTWSPLIEKMNEIRNGNLILVEIKPVYGASFLVLTKKLELVSLIEL